MSFPSPGSPRSPSVWRASRVAATECRDRLSGRQSLPTPSSPRSQDPAARRGLHAGTKAVFLGTMALLGLVGLLHPGGPAILSIRPRGRSLRLPLEARKRAGATQDTWRVVVRRMIGRPQIGCQTPPWGDDGASGRVRETVGPIRTSRRRLRTYTPREYARIALRLRLGRCYPLRALGAGDVRGRRQQASWRGAGSGRPASSDGCPIGRPTAHAPRPRPLAAAHHQCRQPRSRSYRTNGRQAGLASCPG